MSKSEEAWREVGNQFVALGQRLKQHFEERGGEGGERESTQRALRALAETVDRAVSSIGETVRDPAVRDDAQRAASSLADALGTTFAEVGGELRDLFRKRGEGSSGRAGQAPEGSLPPGEEEPPPGSTS